MSLLWLWAAAACALAVSGERSGSSLRGALEALQRRQRGRMHGPLAPQPDYDALYDYLPPQPQPYADPDYAVDVEDLDEEPSPKYTVIKLLDENERPSEAYEYKIIKKKTASPNKKESAFRERSHHSDNDRLRDLFMDRNEAEERKEILQEKTENDAEYALLLSQLWSKYKNIKPHNTIDSAPQGVVKLYKEKYVKKRVPDNWGPIAFKRKRSSGSETEHVLADYEGGRKPHGDGMSVDPNYNAYELSDEDKDDLREEYAIAFQPLDDDSSDFSEEEQYSYDSPEKHFPVSKRSSGPYDFSKTNNQKKRFAQNQNKGQNSRSFRSSSGTDPKIIKDLSRLFGESDNELTKKQVKRSSDDQGNPNETYKPPQVTVLSHNETHHDHNHNHSHDTHNNHDEAESSEHHLHLHHPGMVAKEADHPHDHIVDQDKPKTIKKKSIDWSDYFGIDKRKKKSVSFVNDLSQDRLKKQYFDTFNKEVIYPLNTFRKHSKAKRNFVSAKPNEETEIQIDRTHALAIKSEEKRDTSQQDDTKLDSIDKKLRNMEDLIVDEALKYSNVGEELDSKEEQEMKEKLLSRLAAAYSLEKMRKALKEFKQSLQLQKHDANVKSSPVPSDEVKAKRVAVKKEMVIPDMDNEIPQYNKDKSEDFEDEQGAGQYLNGRIDDQFSEGYMGGSGRHRFPEIPTVAATGSCPVLAKIVQRCRGVDLLAGDRGQLFLPLCSLHQICYLCGEAPPTTCDLVFLSEADTACEGDTGCQRAARSALMTLRELHDNLADELDGECEASPCLSATLKLNNSWQRALQR